MFHELERIWTGAARRNGFGLEEKVRPFETGAGVLVALSPLCTVNNARKHAPSHRYIYIYLFIFKYICLQCIYTVFVIYNMALTVRALG